MLEGKVGMYKNKFEDVWDKYWNIQFTLRALISTKGKHE